MKLIAISITNFRSFTKTQTFEFPQQPGLYFMQGLNEVEPRLGANGAGKSTVWEALTWCFFGKTSRGLKAGDVNNWVAGKGTRVELTFADGGIEYVVTRSWGPISWKLRSKGGDFDDEIDLIKDPSNPVLAILKLEFTPFLNCILTAQGQPMFLDQKAEVQTTLFSAVMGLDRWLEYSSIASRKASSQDSINRVLERKLAELEGQIVATSTEDLKTSVKEWDIKHEAELDKLEQAYNKALAELAVLKAPVEDLKTREEDQCLLLAQIRAPNDELRGRIKQLQTDVADYSTMLAIDAKDLKQATEMLEHFQSTETCPTCHQDIPKAELTKRRRGVQILVTKIESNLAKTKGNLERLTADLKEGKKELAENEEREQEVQLDYDAIGYQVAENRRAIQQQEKLLDRMEEDAEAAIKTKNPYADMQAKALQDLKVRQVELVEVRRRLDDGHSRHSLLSFWVRGFKELRLQLVAEALNELEIEVNSCVAALGLLDWELNFQVDRETKGGSIQRGFSVFVRSPHNHLTVPWEAWSGGEAQRLRLACNMGLADLIRSRSGTDLNLEVWDEPTLGLSPQGAQDLLEALAARARHEQRVIWLIDHRTHAFGDFAGGVTVVKTANGSEIRSS